MTTLQASIDAIVTGKGQSIAFQTFSGGAVISDTARTRDPGSKFDRGVPSPPSVENITTSVDYNESTHGALKSILMGSVGDGSEWAVGHIRRDGAGNRAGLSTYTCLLVRCTPPEGNSNAGSDKATLECEWAPNGPPVG